MYQKKSPLNLECGLHFFKEILSGKWKMMLVHYISQGFKRPSELQRVIPKADRRVMNKQLQELVLHGFLTKKIYDNKISKVEYKLTSLGENLLPLIYTIERWGQENQLELEKAIKRDPKFKYVV
ncbi:MULTISPECIES: winged helix-turn-helix transcriptional regulator [Olivibacter]|uniref:Winged helix-turn-helix transcriptional regulator n=1 Tax=Olivibacter oleidegradans TaxID=760123 RepID=A0ABV6HG40_9SPHI|nr:helix-turn-helix domain-containing protein [Olivibacter sp. LS-1]MDX3916352.1 helix-turn-helix domain-containing protein [Pseudosphingobacterium sp.]QEK99440.1 helix-turn-helix transcriptional regulator [Olivibacter sp. LS-1]